MLGLARFRGGRDALFGAPARPAGAVVGRLAPVQDGLRAAIHPVARGTAGHQHQPGQRAPSGEPSRFHASMISRSLACAQEAGARPGVPSTAMRAVIFSPFRDSLARPEKPCLTVSGRARREGLWPYVSGCHGMELGDALQLRGPSSNPLDFQRKNKTATDTSGMPLARSWWFQGQVQPVRPLLVPRGARSHLT